ncbi:MAG: hypothetical protein ACLSFB_06100 [[Clostridium] scindens]
MNTKRTGIMLLILLSLSGCAAPEQEESTYIAESSDHKDDFGSGEEQDENEDYELKNIKMKPEEVEELSNRFWKSQKNARQLTAKRVRMMHRILRFKKKLYIR